MSISAMQAAKIACRVATGQITNLQLHKILYIAQLLWAGKTDGQPLIVGEPFQAWQYGPVLPGVYAVASQKGKTALTNIFDWVDINNVNESSPEYIFLTASVSALVNRDPFDLVKFTHGNGSAWEKVINEKGIKSTISQKDIYNEYKLRFGEKSA